MRHLESIKGAVLFTDIKDFTLKTSLLTQVQIERLLNEQDEIVLPIVNKYFGKVIKTIGDSYMIVFEKSENTARASIEIQEELEKYNSKIDLNLYKIELRISADFGDLDRKSNLKGEDYFGEAVNIASRLEHKTPENKIFVSGRFYEQIKEFDDIKTIFLGKTTFKGVLFEVGVHEILYKKENIVLLEKGTLKSKNINDILLTEDLKKKITEIDDTIFKFSSVAAILGIQPIPFIDSYSVLPFHVFLLREIAHKYGIQLNKEESKEIFSTIIGSIGSSYALSQGVVGISKLGLVGFGGYLMVPLNFALTYSIGKILSYYFYIKSQGVKATNEELKGLFKYSIKSGKDIAKKDKNKIITTGKKYKDTISKKIEKLFKEKKELFGSIMNKIGFRK